MSLDFLQQCLMPEETGVTYLGLSRQDKAKNFASRKTTPPNFPTLQTLTNFFYNSDGNYWS